MRIEARIESRGALRGHGARHRPGFRGPNDSANGRGPRERHPAAGTLLWHGGASFEIHLGNRGAQVRSPFPPLRAGRARGGGGDIEGPDRRRRADRPAGAAGTCGDHSIARSCGRSVDRRGGARADSRAEAGLGAAGSCRCRRWTGWPWSGACAATSAADHFRHRVRAHAWKPSKSARWIICSSRCAGSAWKKPWTRRNGSSGARLPGSARAGGPSRKIVGRRGTDLYLLDPCEIIAFQAEGELVHIITAAQRYLERPFAQGAGRETRRARASAAFIGAR